MKNLLSVCLLATIFSACQEDPKEKLLNEAFGYYSESEKIHVIVETRLDSLEQLILTQKLLPADSLHQEIAVLKTEFKTWQDNFFEVPGHEHQHEAGHEHHHHDHKKAPDLTPEQMVAVQKEILDNIRKINTKISGL